MADDDLGSLRRPPRLWEQQVQRRLNAVVAGGQYLATAPVVDGIWEGADPIDPEPEIPSNLPPPSTPTLSAGVGTIVASWDGRDNLGQPYPITATVEVHVSLTSGFVPSSATKRGDMPTGGGTTGRSMSVPITLVPISHFGVATAERGDRKSVV